MSEDNGYRPASRPPPPFPQGWLVPLWNQMPLLPANVTVFCFLKKQAPHSSIPGINPFPPLYYQERNPELWPGIDNKRKRGHCSCWREGDISAPLGCQGKEGCWPAPCFAGLLLLSVKRRQQPGRGMLPPPSKLEFSRLHGSNLAGGRIYSPEQTSLPEHRKQGARPDLYAGVSRSPIRLKSSNL